MLVLTRKIGEQIIVADNIRISVIEVGPGRVKIGIEAPKSISVDRAEIYEKKQSEPVPHFVEVPDLHNRIAETLFVQDAARGIQLENRLKQHQHRLPRKPR